jgi:hypothetical protein
MANRRGRYHTISAAIEGNSLCAHRECGRSCLPAAGAESAVGSFATGRNQQQVQPCPLCSNRYRNGEPLKPTTAAS